MKPIIGALLAFLSIMLRSRVSLQLEIVALRHQIMVFQRSATRPRIKRGDRIIWSWIALRWSGWRDALVIVQPAIVIAWQRKRFRDHWAKLSKHGRSGRPPVPNEISDLIRKMSAANIYWGSPRIVGKLRKLGIDVAKSTVDDMEIIPKQSREAHGINRSPSRADGRVQDVVRLGDPVASSAQGCPFQCHRTPNSALEWSTDH